MTQKHARWGLSMALLGGLFVATVAIADITIGQSNTSLSTDVSYSLVTLNKPSDAATGDTLIAGISVNGGSVADITAPSDWTLIARTDNATNVAVASYYKVVGSSEPNSYEWTISPQARATGGITRYSGISGSSPIDTFAGATGRSNLATAPAVTTTADNEHVMTLFAVNIGKGNTLFTTSPGMTKLYDVKNQPHGPTASAQDKLQPSAGPSGTFASSFNAGRGDWVAQTIALQPSSPTATLQNGLLAYWKTDESSGNASDATGNGHTLTNNNGVAYNVGIINNGADFGSTNTDKDLTNSSHIVGFNSNFTYNLWVNISTVPANNANAYQLLGDDDASTVDHKGYQSIQYVQESGEIMLFINRNASGGSNDQYGATINLGTGVWHMLTFTLDGNTIKLYMDGNSSPAISGSSTQTGSNVDLGPDGFGIGNFSRQENFPDHFTSGHIDEVGVWNRVLSSSEISELYSSGAGLPYPF